MSREQLQVDLLIGTVGVTPVGRLSPDTLPGSMSSDEPGGNRRVFVFGFWMGECGVWECDAGVDVADAVERGIISAGITKLADVGDEPFELTINRAGKGKRVLRFTRVED